MLGGAYVVAGSQSYADEKVDPPLSLLVEGEKGLPGLILPICGW